MKSRSSDGSAELEDVVRKCLETKNGKNFGEWKCEREKIFG